MSKYRFLEIAPYGCDVRQSRGRGFDERESETRSAFQRDRDRIIHSTAFRRLKHKTQVFVYHEGDHYRTRLTHSLEVSQIARSIARVLGLDEDLAEALSLAHDLGHTPFGHAGEVALSACMKQYGGFDHNSHALRLVTTLERRYADFDGLNLTWETLEGLVKHNGPLIDAKGAAVGHYAESGIPEITAKIAKMHDIDLASHASIEAQAAALSDDIAYNAHDIDDGLRAGLFEVIDLADVPVIGEVITEVLAKYHDLERSRLIHETVRRLINRMVVDLLVESRRRIVKTEVKTPDDVRRAELPIIAFSQSMKLHNDALKHFLHTRLYDHDKLKTMGARAARVVNDLFAIYMETPDRLPASWQPHDQTDDGTMRARSICDFIAGMTDRFALAEHSRLFGLDP